MTTLTAGNIMARMNDDARIDPPADEFLEEPCPLCDLGLTPHDAEFVLGACHEECLEQYYAVESERRAAADEEARVEAEIDAREEAEIERRYEARRRAEARV